MMLTILLRTSLVEIMNGGICTLLDFQINIKVVFTVLALFPENYLNKGIYVF